LNKRDGYILEQEKNIQYEAEKLKEAYGGIKNIPDEELKEHEFTRINVPGGKQYLYKRIPDTELIVTIS
jgi:hypothetical protein